MNTSKFTIFDAGDDRFGIVAKTPHIASKLNLAFKHYYPKGTSFSPGEEPIFYVPKAQESLLRVTLKISSDTALSSLLG